jgi:acyl-CoA dehydrogenase
MNETATAVDSVVAGLRKTADPSPTGDLPGIWTGLMEQGLAEVAVPESAEGSGGSLADLVDVVTALGRHAVSSPLVEHATARWILAAAGVEAPSGVMTVATRVREDLRSGDTGVETVEDVAWARHATHVVLVGPVETSLVDLGHASVTLEPRVNEAGEPRDIVTFVPEAVTPLSSSLGVQVVADRLGLLWGAALSGAIEATYRLTHGYVNQREQFGAPLVRIPAVAAQLATIKAELVQLEMVRARATRVVTQGEGSRAATIAAGGLKVAAARAATVSARLAHQLHGGMGITAEYPLHHHTTRLWAWRDEGGSEHWWATRLGEFAQDHGEQEMWAALTD